MSNPSTDDKHEGWFYSIEPSLRECPYCHKPISITEVEDHFDSLCLGGEATFVIEGRAEFSAKGIDDAFQRLADHFHSLATDDDYLGDLFHNSDLSIKRFK